MIHWISLFEALRSLISDGIATLRIVLSMTMISRERHSTPNVHHRRAWMRSSSATSPLSTAAVTTRALPVRIPSVSILNRPVSYSWAALGGSAERCDLGRMRTRDRPVTWRPWRSTPRWTAASLRLTEWTSCGGCAAKWGAAVLAEMVGELPGSVDPALLVGLAPFDDAAIYRLDDSTALVSTTDFFPPLVDDPSDYGAIAAANACSDVFAMGGRVVLAVNVAAFPEHFPRWAMAAIFDAAATVVAEAGGTVAGGHTIRNPEPVFGLAVQGVVHPDRVFRKGGARPGDAVLLSKPLGTGLTLAGGDDEDKAAATAGMRTLNRRAAELLQSLGSSVHAVTDVTGYGLAGHGWEVAERSDVRLVIDADGLVAYPGAVAAAERGVRTGGDARNRDYVAGHIDSARLRRRRGAGVRPADLRRTAGRRRTGRRSRAGGVGVLVRRHDRGRRPRRGSPMSVPMSADLSRSGRRRARWSASCGTSATTTSWASTRSAAARGPGR